MLWRHRGPPACCPHLSYCTAADGQQLQKAFRTLQLLDEKGIPVSRDFIYSILQECIKHKNLSAGRRVHSLIVCRGLDSTTCFNDHLIRLFASCGSLPEANHVFESVTCPRTHTWNAIISAHVQLGQNERALDLYHRMLQDGGALVDKATLSCILKACSALGAIEQGRLIHGHALEEALDCDVVVMNTIVVMYVKSCSIEDARDVFDGLRNRNIVSWGAIICGYSEQGYGACALDLFEKMQFEGLEPSRAIFLAALKACSIIGGITEGRKIHDHVIRSAFGSDLAIESTLVDMYAKCGSVDEACAVFQESRNTDIVTWGAMIAGYTDNGQGWRAFEVYKKMQEANVKPNTAVFISLLKACGGLENGMLVHEEITKTELDLDLAIRTGLIDMYSRCGSLAKGQEVFNESFERDSVLWGAIITACVQHGHKDRAVQLFERMIAEGTRLKAETFISLLKACDNGASYLGWLIHDGIVRGGYPLGVALGSALVDMYGKHGYVDEAHRVFDQLHDRNVISWGGMIAGYVQQGLELSALALFNTMLENSIKPDKATLSCIAKACAGVGAIKQGRKVHDLILRNNYESDKIVNTALVDMYAKCGSLVEACKVFDGTACQDVVLWGVIIASCCLHGNLILASQYLRGMSGMEEHGSKPISVIFTSMLTACCYAGKLAEGQRLFKFMREDYGIIPDEEHYSCMVDLLSRVGSLNDARTLLQSIPYQSDLIMGTSLLTGCKTYGNVDMGSRYFEKAFELDSEDASAYVLMSQIYVNHSHKLSCTSLDENISVATQLPVIDRTP